MLGPGAVWGRLTGKVRRIKQQNELDAWHASRRDTAVRDTLIFQHLEERQRLQVKINTMRKQRSQEITDIQRSIAEYMKGKSQELPRIQKLNKPEFKTRNHDRHSQRTNSGPELNRD